MVTKKKTVKKSGKINKRELEKVLLKRGENLNGYLDFHALINKAATPLR